MNTYKITAVFECGTVGATDGLLPRHILCHAYSMEAAQDIGNWLCAAAHTVTIELCVCHD